MKKINLVLLLVCCLSFQSFDSAQSAPIVPKLSKQSAGERKSSVPVDLPSDLVLLKGLAGNDWPAVLDKEIKLQEEILKAGPIQPELFGKAMKILAALLEHDREIPKQEQRYRTAIAISLEFPMDYLKKGEAEAIERYVWYRDAQASHKLHKSFDDLQTWERRMVVNLPWHHGDGSPVSLDWLNKEVKLPPEKYVDACWQAPYQSFNPFGETVQGPDYYVPFEGEFTAHEMRREVGGVCGGLSHYGSVAARANGIPSTTMGEPGHCAYAVRLNGEWKAAYSLSTERSPHQCFFKFGWPGLVLQDVVYKDTENTLTATRYLCMARMMAESDASKAVKWIEKAQEIQPQNPLIWDAKLKLLSMQKNTVNWLTEARELGKSFAGFPSIAVAILDSLNKKAGALSSEDLRLKMLVSCLEEANGEKVKETCPLNWSAYLKDIYSFGGGKNKEVEIAKAVLKVTISGPDGFHYLTDAMDRFKDDQNTLNAVLEIASNQHKNSGTESNKDSQRKIIELCMDMAGKQHDPVTYQRLAKLHPEPITGKLTAPKNVFPGKLISGDGAVAISSTCHWDKPAGHAQILTMQGGIFHTDEEDNSYVEITLTKMSKISGIIITNTDGNRGRAVPLVVETSEDGKSWSEVFNTDKAAPEWQVDLVNKNVKAKFVRIRGAVGRKDFLHLQRVLIYGIPQA